MAAGGDDPRAQVLTATATRDTAGDTVAGIWVGARAGPAAEPALESALERAGTWSRRGGSRGAWALIG